MVCVIIIQPDFKHLIILALLYEHKIIIIIK